MTMMEMPQSDARQTHEQGGLLAPWWHTALMVIMIISLSVAGVKQLRSFGSQPLHLATNYILTIVYEWVFAGGAGQCSGENVGIAHRSTENRRCDPETCAGHGMGDGALPGTEHLRGDLRGIGFPRLPAAAICPHDAPRVARGRTLRAGVWRRARL